MPGSTAITIHGMPNSSLEDDVTSWSQVGGGDYLPQVGGGDYLPQAWEGEFFPTERLFDKTIYIDPDRPSEFVPTSVQAQQRMFEPSMPMPWSPTGADSTPLQIWEGSVLQVDREAGVMHVMLVAKMGQVPRHTADIDLEWVSDQDQDLVCPGAVFYLTLFKRTRRGSIENSQELRFRRRPSWSAAQLKRIDEDASTLLAKMTPLPSAE